MAAPARSLLETFFALSLRERVLSFLALCGVVFVAVYLLWVSPQQSQARDLRERLKQQETEGAALAAVAQIAAIKPRPQATEAVRKERDTLRAAVREADAVIQQASSPVKMSEVIRAAAAGLSGVTLASVKTLAPEPLYVPNAAPAKAAASDAKPATAGATVAPVPAIYKRGIEVTLYGSYTSLMPYVRQLQQSAPAVYWGAARLDVAEYPAASLKLVLYTLSVQPEASFE